MRLVIALILLSLSASAQVQYIGGTATTVINRGAFVSDSVMILPKRDTTAAYAAQRYFGRITMGVDSSMYFHNGTKWVKLASGSISVDSNVYETVYRTDTLTVSVYDSITAHRIAIDSKADASALSGYVPTSRTISTTSPLSGGGDLSTNRTLTIADAAADGSTKGAAAFTANDFNATLGVLSLDYTNGQAASGSNKGFLTSADWTTFNGKVGGSGTANYISKFTASGTIGNSTIRDDGSNVGIGGAPNASYKTYNNGSFFNNGILYLLGGGSGGIRSVNSVYIDALNAGGASIFMRYGNNIDKTFELTRALSYINGLFQAQGGFSVRGNVVTTGTTGLALHIGSTTTYTELRSYNQTDGTYSPLYINAPAILNNTSTNDGSGREFQNNGQIGSTDTIYTATVMREAGITSSLLKTTSNGTHAAAVAGTDYITPTGTSTLSNKRITQRVLPITSSATPTINTDNYDAVKITALSTAITSMTTNLSGTPNDFDKLLITIEDDGTGRAITWGASFIDGAATLPTTTTANKKLYVGLVYSSTSAKWECLASGEEP